MPGMAGAVIGRAAGGDQDVFRRDGLAGREPQRVGILEHRAGLDDARAGFLDIGGVDALEPGDLLVLVGDQRRPVERHRRNGPAEARGVLDLVVDVRADHEQLFRHAAADHAGAAHPVLFGDHHPRAMAGGDPGGAHPARTSSDHEQIDVELSHVSPDRSDSLARVTHYGSDLLAALAHLGAELAVDDLGKILRPRVHIGHAELNCPGLRRSAVSGPSGVL